MGLVVLAAAPVAAFIEVATVRARLELEESDDEQIGELIDEVCPLIIARFGRDLVRQQYRETLPETGRTRLILSRYPIDPDSLSVSIRGVEIDSTAYSVEDAAKGILYMASGWGARPCHVGEDGEPVIVATYAAGYLIPEAATRIGVVSTWSAAATYAAHSWARPASLAKASPLRFECTTGGVAGSSEPAWPAAAGETVDDGAVTWTARRAPELPVVMRSLAWLSVQDAFTRLDRPAGLAALSAEGFSENYFATHTEMELPPNVLRSIDQLRFAL